MRKKDEKKNFDGKAQKTINFDKLVLREIERRAQEEGTTASNLVNQVCRRIFMSDKAFYSEMAKEYYVKFQEMMYMKDVSEVKVER